MTFQVDVIESQFSTFTEKMSSTRDFEQVKLAHDQFLSALLSQSFVHMKAVSISTYQSNPPFLLALLLTRVILDKCPSQIFVYLSDWFILSTFQSIFNNIDNCWQISSLVLQVSRCLHEILDQCSQFSKLLVNCSSPLSKGELSHLQFIAKVSLGSPLLCFLKNTLKCVNYFCVIYLVNMLIGKLITLSQV